jgi:hypothetical protein
VSSAVTRGGGGVSYRVNRELLRLMARSPPGVVPSDFNPDVPTRQLYIRFRNIHDVPSPKSLTMDLEARFPASFTQGTPVIESVFAPHDYNYCIVLFKQVRFAAQCKQSLDVNPVICKRRPSLVAYNRVRFP